MQPKHLKTIIISFILILLALIPSPIFIRVKAQILFTIERRYQSILTRGEKIE